MAKTIKPNENIKFYTFNLFTSVLGTVRLRVLDPVRNFGFHLSSTKKTCLKERAEKTYNFIIILLFSLFVIWALFELFIRTLFRREIPCPHCGFDASWYRKDVKMARRLVKDFWENEASDSTEPEIDYQENIPKPSASELPTEANL